MRSVVNPPRQARQHSSCDRPKGHTYATANSVPHFAATPDCPQHTRSSGRGIIHYTREDLRILARPGLERAVAAATAPSRSASTPCRFDRLVERRWKPLPFGPFLERNSRHVVPDGV